MHLTTPKNASRFLLLLKPESAVSVLIISEQQIEIQYFYMMRLQVLCVFRFYAIFENDM